MTKIEIKKLPKPIRLLIEIRVRTWHDKMYGNTYYSARIRINQDYANDLIIPYAYSKSDWRQDLLAEIQNRFNIPRGIDLCGSDSELAAQGIHISVSNLATTKRICREFGL